MPFKAQFPFVFSAFFVSLGLFVQAQSVIIDPVTQNVTVLTSGSSSS
jgi:hypothetical protein